MYSGRHPHLWDLANADDWLHTWDYSL